MFVLVVPLRNHCLAIHYLSSNRAGKWLLWSCFSVHTIPCLLLPGPCSFLLHLQKPQTNTNMYPYLLLTYALVLSQLTLILQILKLIRANNIMHVNFPDDFSLLANI